MSVKAAIHSKFPCSRPSSKPAWARLTRCTQEMLVAKSAMPIIGQVRVLPARKYSRASPPADFLAVADAHPAAGSDDENHVGDGDDDIERGDFAAARIMEHGFEWALKSLTGLPIHRNWREMVLHILRRRILNNAVKQCHSPPIYHGGADRFVIDDCAPQVAAMREGKIELHALSQGALPGKANEFEHPARAVEAWVLELPQGIRTGGFNPHRNEGIEIVFLETGGMGFEVDGERSHDLQAGHLTLTRPWQLHKLGDPCIGRGRLYWMILDVGREASEPGMEMAALGGAFPEDLSN
jgi:hypothetical protein